MGQEESVSKGKLADSSLASIPNSALKGGSISFTNHISFSIFIQAGFIRFQLQ